MADSTGDELDRRIRKLMGAAGDEGPTVMTSLPASTFQGATSHLFERRRWLAMAVVGLLIVGVGALAFGNHNPMRSATPITGTSESAVTTAFTEASASEVPTTPVVTTAPDPITRPFMGPPICASGSAREFLSRGITYRPFALDYQGTMLLQVLAATTDGVAKPFAAVLRVPASNRTSPTPIR